MKDINLILDVLNEHKIPHSKYASEIGTTRQNITNWKKNSKGIPKEYLMPTIKFLKKHTGKTIKAEKLLSCLHPNNTPTKHPTTTTQGQQ